MTEAIIVRQRRGRPSSPTRSADRVDLHVGSRIRLRRAELGISQQELAERVGIAFQQIQKYEVGRNRVSASRLYDIGRALGVSVSYFFHGLGLGGSDAAGPSSRSSLPRLVNDPTMIRFLTLLSRQSGGDFRERAAAIVRVVANGEARDGDGRRSVQ